jgi:threonine/homoserine/homoserine lactone efflux protein
MPFQIFLSSFVIALSGALMPGPFLTVTIVESSRIGFRAGPLMILGHGILELMLVVLLFYGLGDLLRQPLVFGLIGLLGGAVLLWMAWGMFRDLPKLRLDLSPRRGGPKNQVWAGILVSLSNPYWIIWWASIGLGYILFAAQYGLWGLVLFFLGHILADFLWYALVALSVAKGKRLLGDRGYRTVIGVCAAFLVLLGFYFGWSGFRNIFQT